MSALGCRGRTLLVRGRKKLKKRGTPLEEIFILSVIRRLRVWVVYIIGKISLYMVITVENIR